MKCNNCGAEISDEARFCEKCGSPVSADAAAQAASDSLTAPVEDIPAPKPLEQPLSAGAVPFVPMAPAPRAMPRSMRAPRPYAPHPGFSPAQPGTSKPKRVASLSDLAEQIPPAPDPEASREQREDEAALATDQATWDKYPAANGGELSSAEEEARDARRREREEEQRRRREAKERRAQAKREERERREAERTAKKAAEAEAALAAAAAKTEAEAKVRAAAEPVEPAESVAPIDPDATTQLRVPAVQATAPAPASAVPAKTGASRRAIAAIAAVVVIAIVGVVAVGAMGHGGQAPADAPAQSEPKGDQATNAGSNPTDEGNDADTAVAVKSSVEDYSWDELSELSAQIAAADSDSAALEIAKKYNLCNGKGKLDGTQTKKLELSNGKTVTMRIVGFRQDERADGSGKAGITMISAGEVASRYVSQAGTYSGWEGSELRTWMNEDLLDELPDEVSSKVVEVSKKTVGYESTSATDVSDKLWIPSFSEVVGKLTAGMKRSDSYVPEGEQYQLFADEDVQWGGTYSILGTKGADAYWWLRSIDPLNNQYYLCVSEAGEPWYSHLPATEHAILMGFCL